jgi:hypothetical protein
MSTESRLIGFFADPIRWLKRLRKRGRRAFYYCDDNSSVDEIHFCGLFFIYTIKIYHGLEIKSIMFVFFTPLVYSTSAPLTFSPPPSLCE